MSSYDPHPRKTPGSDTKPARTVLESGEEFAAPHHFVTETERWVCAYENGRDGGVDYRFPSSSVAFIDTTSNTDAGRERVDTEDTAVTAPAGGSR
jgi:hypothetical protein